MHKQTNRISDYHARNNRRGLFPNAGDELDRKFAATCKSYRRELSRITSFRTPRNCEMTAVDVSRIHSADLNHFYGDGFTTRRSEKSNGPTVASQKGILIEMCFLEVGRVDFHLLVARQRFT